MNFFCKSTEYSKVDTRPTLVIINNNFGSACFGLPSFWPVGGCGVVVPREQQQETGIFGPTIRVGSVKGRAFLGSSRFWKKLPSLPSSLLLLVTNRLHQANKQSGPPTLYQLKASTTIHLLPRPTSGKVSHLQMGLVGVRMQCVRSLLWGLLFFGSCFLYGVEIDKCFTNCICMRMNINDIIVSC